MTQENTDERDESPDSGVTTLEMNVDLGNIPEARQEIQALTEDVEELTEALETLNELPIPRQLLDTEEIGEALEAELEDRRIL